jgi:hypothetical protein
VQDRSEFRALVNQFAEGLGLRILDWGEHGFALAPAGESPFALKGASFRSNRTDAEERLLDGLVQVAIAATLFPTPQEQSVNQLFVFGLEGGPFLDAQPPLNQTPCQVGVGWLIGHEWCFLEKG